MNKFIELTYTELLEVEGGNCPKCRQAGIDVGKIIKDNLVWEGVSSAWEEIKSWFN